MRHGRREMGGLRLTLWSKLYIMKRIHLFEFEDFSWFPNWLRVRMTRLIVVMHRLMGTSEELAKIIDQALRTSGETKIMDLCSGSGGPMPDVVQVLEEKYNRKNIELTLSDLYPNLKAAERFNSEKDNVSYETYPVDVTKIGADKQGLRTMICSFHHIKPEAAKQILQSAQNDQKPICIFEISDNSAPILPALIISFPITFLMCLFITPLARPMTWQQLVFTYLIPIIPICYAWDGSVSNVRTYTTKDLQELISDIETPDYKWEIGTIGERMKKLYLTGMPVRN